MSPGRSPTPSWRGGRDSSASGFGIWSNDCANAINAWRSSTLTAMIVSKSPDRRAYGRPLGWDTPVGRRDDGVQRQLDQVFTRSCSWRRSSGRGAASEFAAPPGDLVWVAQEPPNAARGRVVAVPRLDPIDQVADACRLRCFDKRRVRLAVVEVPGLDVVAHRARDHAESCPAWIPSVDFARRRASFGVDLPGALLVRQRALGAVLRRRHDRQSRRVRWRAARSTRATVALLTALIAPSVGNQIGGRRRRSRAPQRGGRSQRARTRARSRATFDSQAGRSARAVEATGAWQDVRQGLDVARRRPRATPRALTSLDWGS